MQQHYIAMKRKKQKLVGLSIQDFYLARIASFCPVDFILINEAQSNLATIGTPSISQQLCEYYTRQVRKASAVKAIAVNLPPTSDLEDLKELKKAGATLIGIDADRSDLITRASDIAPFFVIVNHATPNILNQLKHYEKLGCLVIKANCELDTSIIHQLQIPVIGTDKRLDGHCFSMYDICGLSADFGTPGTSYLEGSALIKNAVNEYCNDMRYGPPEVAA